MADLMMNVWGRYVPIDCSVHAASLARETVIVTCGGLSTLPGLFAWLASFPEAGRCKGF